MASSSSVDPCDCSAAYLLPHSRSACRLRIASRTMADIASAMSRPVLTLRPSWNTSFAASVMLLRGVAYSLPVDVKRIRYVTDHDIPTWLPTLPGGVSCKFNSTPPGEWFYPANAEMGLPDLADPSSSISPLRRHYSGRFVLYLHGGAFCVCSTSTHRGIMFRMVESTGCRIFSVDYRRPPEHCFPVPVDDCLAAYRLLLACVPASQIFIAGDSAGGNLVISTIVRAQKEGLPSPAGAILMSPWVHLEDVDMLGSWARNRAYDFIPAPIAKLFAESYRGEARYEEVSPLLFPDSDIAGLPPVLLECGDCEVLCDQITLFDDRCRALGVDIRFNLRPDMVHIFPLFSFTGMSQCNNTFDAIKGFMTELCSPIR